MVATLPPSVSGVRATILLKKLFNRYGGTYLLGNTVVSGSIKNNKIVSIQTEKMQDEDLEAEYFILSSGSFLVMVYRAITAEYTNLYSILMLMQPFTEPIGRKNTSSTHNLTWNSE